MTLLENVGTANARGILTASGSRSARASSITLALATGRTSASSTTSSTRAGSGPWCSTGWSTQPSPAQR